MKLKFKIVTLLVLVILIPMLISTFMAEMIVRIQNDDDAKQRIGNTADMIAYDIFRLNQDYQNMAQSFSTTDSVVLRAGILYTYKKSLGFADWENIRAKFREDLSHLILGKEIDLIVFRDIDGNVLAAVSGEKGLVPPFDKQASIQAALNLNENKGKEPNQMDLIVINNHLIMRAGRSVSRKNNIIGTLYIFRIIDRDFLAKLVYSRGIDVAFFINGKYLVGTKPEIRAATDLNQSNHIKDEAIGKIPYLLSVRPFVPSTGIHGVMVIGASKTDTIRKSAQTRKILFTIAGICSILGALIGYFISGTIVGPLNKLVKGVEDVGKGDYESTIDFNSHDEFGHLADKFNQMVESLSVSRSELSHANQDLFYMKEYIESIVESIAIGIIVVNSNLLITLLNNTMKREWHIYPEKYLEQPIELIFNKKNDSQFLKLLHEVVDKGTARELYNIRRKFNREDAVLNIRIFPLKDRNALSMGAVIILEDISHRVKLEEELIYSEKLASMGILSAGIAHEINNPLGIILSHTQLLLNTVPESEDRRSLQRIETETRRAAWIVRSLLDFSRNDENETEQVQVNIILDVVISLVRYEMKHSRIELVREFSSEIPLVLGEESQLKQVFLNVIINSIQAMPNGGQLTIATRLVQPDELPKDLDRTKSMVCVKIIDTGTGIPKEHLNKIFDPFFTTKPVGKGTGLGLSVSYGIIQRHGGKITVQSEKGKGSAFAIYLLPIETAIQEKDTAAQII